MRSRLYILVLNLVLDQKWLIVGFPRLSLVLARLFMASYQFYLIVGIDKVSILYIPYVLTTLETLGRRLEILGGYVLVGGWNNPEF